MSTVTENTVPSTVDTVRASLPADAVASLERHAPGILKDSETIRILHGRTRDVKVALGRKCRKLWNEWETLKVDTELARTSLIALCGDAPNTGKPYEWGQVRAMIDGSEIIDSLPADVRKDIGGIGVDSALALKRIADADERRTFFIDRAKSGESMSAKPLRAAADEFNVDRGNTKRVTLKGKTDKLVSKWKESDTLAGARLVIDVVPASPEYADAIEAAVKFTLNVAFNGKVEPQYTNAVAQLLFPGGKPKRTPTPRKRK